MAKGIRYVTTNSAKVTNADYAGTHQSFSVVALPEEFEGETEQEQIEKALASGLASEPSDAVPVDFPAEKPGTPTDFKSSNVTWKSATLSWKAPEKAQSYLLFKGADAIAYKETLTHNFEDESVENSTVGFFLQAFNEKFTGSSEQAKIDAALASGRGGDKTAELKVTFPQQKPVTPTKLASKDLKADAVTLTWTAGSSRGIAWVLHRNINDPSDDPKNAIYMDYATDKTFTLTDDIFAGKLAGQRISFWVQEFHVLGQGETDQEKADWLNKNALGSEWSEKVTVDFPEE